MRRYTTALAGAAIAALALMLVLPAAVTPPRLYDSFWIDWVWLDQFSQQLRSGVLYPRWLPLSHGGLGSPVFYYYPPVAFYVGSVFALAGLSIYMSIVATFLVGFAISGAAMYLWLKGQVHPAGALLGALIYMAAPYHAFNFYGRGASAEFLATALLPLVMLGLRRISEERRGGFVLTAVSYAGCIGTHLPLALLGSLFLFGPYALILARERPRTLFRLGAAASAGIALAAAYLLPALTLGQFRDAAVLWQHPSLQPHNWTFWQSGVPLNSNAYWATVIISGALAVPCLALILWRRSGWGWLALGCLILAVGVVPAFWSLPVLRSVQFPFRLLPVAEFALATALGLLRGRELRLLVGVVPMLAISWLVIMATPEPNLVSIAELQAQHPDVPENLPPGKRPYSWPSRWALEIAKTKPVPSVPGLTVERVFYFPAWKLRCEGQQVLTFAAPDTQLLAYAGRNCTRALGYTAAERTGAIISVLALLVLLIIAAREQLLRTVSARKDGAQEVI